MFRRRSRLGDPDASSPPHAANRLGAGAGAFGGREVYLARRSRLAELRALRLYDPVALLAIYKQGADLDQLAKRPGGVTYATMIAAILEREQGNDRPMDSVRCWRSVFVGG